MKVMQTRTGKSLTSSQYQLSVIFVACVVIIFAVILKNTRTNKNCQTCYWICYSFFHENRDMNSKHKKIVKLFSYFMLQHYAHEILFSYQRSRTKVMVMQHQIKEEIELQWNDVENLLYSSRLYLCALEVPNSTFWPQNPNPSLSGMDIVVKQVPLIFQQLQR